MSRFRVVDEEVGSDIQALVRRFSFSSPSAWPSPSSPSQRQPPIPPRRSPQRQPGLWPIAEDGPRERAAAAGMATPARPPPPSTWAPPPSHAMHAPPTGQRQVASPKRSRAPRTTPGAGRMQVDTASRAMLIPTGQGTGWMQVDAPPLSRAMLMPAGQGTGRMQVDAPPPSRAMLMPAGQGTGRMQVEAPPPSRAMLMPAGQGTGRMQVDAPPPSRAMRLPATGQGTGRMQVDGPPPSRAMRMPTGQGMSRMQVDTPPPSRAMRMPTGQVPVTSHQMQVVVCAALRELERRRAADAALQQLQVWAAQAARQQSQGLRLYTVEGMAAGYGTNWAELHPQSQELLQHIENKMREYKHGSDLLDQCGRLYDPSMSNRDFELYASQISQEIGSTFTIMDREMASTHSLMAVVKEMMWNADFAIHSYIKLRPNFIHRYSGTADAGFAHRARPSGAPTDFNQPSAMGPTFDFYSGAAMRPSPFMQCTVSKFENHLEECSRMVGQLEQLIQIKNDTKYSNALESLSIVVPNVYDYLIHVASQVENLHQYAEIMRTHYRNVWWLMADCSDPFLDADRREATKQEAASRILHPTGVGVSMLASQPWQSSSPTGATSSSTRAVLQTSPAPSPNTFSSSGSMLQSTPFGSASTLALGSTPARFASSPSFSALGGTSLFRTPPGGC